MTRAAKLKVSLATRDEERACIDTLKMCASIARSLCDDSEEMSGPIALLGLAGVFDHMIETITTHECSESSELNGASLTKSGEAPPPRGRSRRRPAG